MIDNINWYPGHMKKTRELIRENLKAVDCVVEIVDSLDVPVMAYGLKNDFRNELFEGSYYMLVYADKIEEIKTICWCGRKATMVARVIDGKMVKEGDQIVVGGMDMYVPLCRKHYNDGRLGPMPYGIDADLKAGEDAQLRMKLKGRK